MDLEHPEKVGVADRPGIDELEAKTLALWDGEFFFTSCWR